MPFTKPSSEELERITHEVLAAIRKQDSHPLAQPQGMTFRDIERTAHAIGQRVAARLTADALLAHAEEAPESAPCPNCQLSCRLTQKKRTITTLDAPVDYLEPAAHCDDCRRDFFPQRPQLHRGERQYSPDFQYKLTETAARTRSFSQASQIAEIWSDHPVSSRNLTRIAEEVGHELVAKRDARVDDFTHRRRGPEGPDPKHPLVAVFVDGGRVQVREEPCGPGIHDPRWQEDKITRLQTMSSTTHAVDPCPEPPVCFHKPILASAGTPLSSPSISPEISNELQSFLDGNASSQPISKWQPEPWVRTWVGTMKPLDEFRWMVQAEAKRRHVYTAKKRAFVADGSHGNGSLWKDHFSDFVPILDFVHAAEYLHAAAKALESMTLGCEWVRDLWQGRSGSVIAVLRASLDVRGIGEETLEDSHPLFGLQRAWRYLSNASDKLDYPRYRREGLPCTRSLIESQIIESQIKEFNSRLKGSEKFWYESNAEAMVELVCGTLREDAESLEDYFATRPTSQFRWNDPKTVA